MCHVAIVGRTRAEYAELPNRLISLALFHVRCGRR